MSQTSISPELIKATINFHGHSCPGLAIGIRAAELAINRFGRSMDEEIVAVVETDMCAVDAIQFLLGCTFGKGNLIHLDYGKSAFTFHRRQRGKSIRIVARPNAIGDPDDELIALRTKELKEKLTHKEQERLKEAIASGKGGTGKTTLSTNLASYIAQDRSVVLADLDVEEPNSGLFIKARLLRREAKYKMIPEWSEETCIL